MVNSVSFSVISSFRVNSLSRKFDREKSIAFNGSKKDVFISTVPKITKVTKNKLDELCPLYLRYRKSANSVSNTDEVKRYLQTELKKGDDSIYVAKIANIPVGFLHFGIERSTLRNSERIRLKALFVDENYRGKGIAKQLLAQVQQDAGDREVVVKARKSNQVSPFLYFNNGFVEDDEYFHLVYKK